MTNRIERYSSHVVLALFALGAIYPALSIVFLALHRKNDLVTGFAFPTTVDLSTFRAAFNEGNFSTGFKSSFIVAIVVTVISAILSIGTGYAFGTMRMTLAGPIFSIVMLGIIFPMEAAVIPLYYDFQSLHLLNTYWALILPQIGQSVALGTFWMRSFFRSTPRSLVEAARIDGASSWTILTKVLLPQARPALTTLCALVFTYTWNEFLLALVLVSGDETKQTAPLDLSFFAGTAKGNDPTKVAAAAVLVALPVVVAYILLQRHFIRGMLSGAVKE
jgi:raffinose/stachyose/melibiose transport system permease protein